MIQFDTQYRAIDSLAIERVDVNDSDDEDGWTWDEQTRVTIDNGPWIEAFGTDQFHKAEYVVTKPAEQPYFVDGEQYTFTKPRTELKEAQWRLDNLPWTIEHPPTKEVVSMDQARGFWRGPSYDEDADEQRATLYVPANDEEALTYASEHEGVSVGFRHGLAKVEEYEGEIGGDVETDNVDGLQTDIYYNHVATVENPRLPDTGRVAGDALPNEVGADGQSVDFRSLVSGASEYAGMATVDARANARGRTNTPHIDEMADVRLSTQASDGSTVVVDFAVSTRQFYVGVHTRGDEHRYTTPSLSPPLGEDGPFDPNTVVRDHEIVLDEPLHENTEVFATLHYATPNGQKAGHLLGSKDWVMDRTDVVVTSTSMRADDTGGDDSSCDPEHANGDWVQWNFSDGNARGRVTSSKCSGSVSVEGGSRNGSTDNPAYRLEHWDDGSFGNNVVKRESELSSAEPPADYSSDAVTTTTTKARASPSDYEYTDEGAAARAAEELGCKGTHQHDDGTWMPCASHETLVKTLEALNSTLREEMDSLNVDDSPQGIHVEEDTWYGIAPSEHGGDDVPKYPLTSCTGSDSVEDAWNLRAHGHYDIDQSTLEARIERAANAMDCDMEFDGDTDNDSLQMSDEFDLDDLTVDTIAEQHDGVADVIEQKQSLDSRVEELEEQRNALQEELDEHKTQLDEYKEAERKREVDERISRLTDLTDKWDEDELTEMDVDSHEEHIQRLDERIKIYSDFTDPSTPEADDAGGEDGGGDGAGDEEYVGGEVYDLSNTA